MTYFHINLDPRGKKKSFAANSYTRDYIGFFFFLFLFCLFESFWVLFFFFSERAFKDTSSGRNVGDHSAILEAPEGATSLGLRVQANVGQLNHLLGVGFRLLLPVQ